MTWTRLPGTFFREPEVLSVPPMSRLLLLELATWSNEHHTEGRVPAAIVAQISLLPRSRAEEELMLGELLVAGLLEANEDGTVLVIRHDELVTRTPERADR